MGRKGGRLAEAGDLLPVVVAHDEGGADVLDGPRSREAARGHVPYKPFPPCCAIWRELHA